MPKITSRKTSGSSSIPKYNVISELNESVPGSIYVKARDQFVSLQREIEGRKIQKEVGVSNICRDAPNMSNKCHSHLRKIKTNCFRGVEWCHCS